MSRSKKKRPAISVAASYDPRAMTGVVVAVLHAAAPRYFEEVVCGAAPKYAALTALAVKVARELGLKDVVIATSERLDSPAEEICDELGDVRITRRSRRRTLMARQWAHRRLRELVPLPPREPEVYSLADWGVDLEIQRLEAEAAETPGARNAEG